VRPPELSYPDVCPRLETSGAAFLDLLRSIRKIPAVNTPSSPPGCATLAVAPGQRRLLRELMQHHVEGR